MVDHALPIIAASYDKELLVDNENDRIDERSVN